MIHICRMMEAELSAQTRRAKSLLVRKTSSELTTKLREVTETEVNDLMRALSLECASPSVIQRVVHRSVVHAQLNSLSAVASLQQLRLLVLADSGVHNADALALCPLLQLVDLHVCTCLIDFIRINLLLKHLFRVMPRSGLDISLGPIREIQNLISKFRIIN